MLEFSNQTKFQVNIDRNLMEDGEVVLRSLGLSKDNFITMAYKRLVAEQKLPFDDRATDDEKAALTILMESRKLPHTVLDSPEKVADWASGDD